MTAKNNELLKNLLIVGSGGAFVISTFLATVVFDKVSPNTTLPDQEIEMGTGVQLTDGHIEIFMDAVLLTQTIVDIKDIVKTDENGENAEPGSIGDLFPVGTPAYGRGVVEFRIKSISRDQMPNLANRSQISIPMLYVRQETFSELVKSTVKLASIGIKMAGLMAWMGVLFAIGCIIAGAGLIYLDKAKTPVEELDED
ncbi:uncharacterized protein LOC118439508 [Folsomia candida]|uniref:uncharacterized protein LOC118439508 n=1 Tax=Folsomia candida TaxID=158441 RepID=UPI001605076D|nr:uncharacterized protein LOC118439508 [Folsomia candida]